MKSVVVRSFALLPLLLLGCDKPLEPGTKVDSFRVLAQQVDLPYAHPGETVKLSALSFDPQNRPVNWLWASCVNPEDSSLESCLAKIGEQPDPEASIFAQGEGQDAPELTIPADVLEQLPTSARGFASVGVVSAACPGQLSVGEGPGGLPFRCQETGTGRDMALDEFIVGVKRITVRESERNQNPSIASITFDGTDWPADEVKEVGSCGRDDFEYASCPDGDKHKIVPIPSADSIEKGTDELGRSFEEQLVVQFYATEGIFEYETKTGKDSKTGWVARSAASGQTLKLWFVLRDNRGGVTWAERQVRVR